MGLRIVETPHGRVEVKDEVLARDSWGLTCSHEGGWRGMVIVSPVHEADQYGLDPIGIEPVLNDVVVDAAAYGFAAGLQAVIDGSGR